MDNRARIYYCLPAGGRIGPDPDGCSAIGCFGLPPTPHPVVHPARFSIGPIGRHRHRHYHSRIRSFDPVGNDGETLWRGITVQNVVYDDDDYTVRYAAASIQRKTTKCSWNYKRELADSSWDRCNGNVVGSVLGNCSRHEMMSHSQRVDCGQIWLEDCGLLEDWVQIWNKGTVISMKWVGLSFNCYFMVKQTSDFR